MGARPVGRLERALVRGRHASLLSAASGGSDTSAETRIFRHSCDADCAWFLVCLVPRILHRNPQRVCHLSCHGPRCIQLRFASATEAGSSTFSSSLFHRVIGFNTDNAQLQKSGLIRLHPERNAFGDLRKQRTVLRRLQPAHNCRLGARDSRNL